MNRFHAYMILYLGCLVGFSLFFWVSFVDSLIFSIFLLASLYYIFAAEELPKGIFTDSPQVHSYQKNRINFYGFVMAGTFAFVAFIYYYSTFQLGVRSGVAVIALWPILLGVSYVTSKVSSKEGGYSLIRDFIRKNSRENHESLDGLIYLIHSLYIKGLRGEELEEHILTNHKFVFERKFLHETMKLYTQYINKITTKITSEEVHEFNKFKHHKDNV